MQPQQPPYCCRDAAQLQGRVGEAWPSLKSFLTWFYPTSLTQILIQKDKKGSFKAIKYRTFNAYGGYKFTSRINSHNLESGWENTTFWNGNRHQHKYHIYGNIPRKEHTLREGQCERRQRRWNKSKKDRSWRKVVGSQQKTWSKKVTFVHWDELVAGRKTGPRRPCLSALHMGPWWLWEC